MPVDLEDASGYRGVAEAAFHPATEEELLEILRRAVAERRPVTAGGAHTGVTGGGVPVGGWYVSLDRLRSVRVLRGRAIAGAGVLLADLQAEAARSGQFYPPDPTEHTASVGGTVATNASGSRSFLYGDTRRQVLGLRVALLGESPDAVRIAEFARGDKVDFPVPRLPLPETTKHTAGYRLGGPMDWVDLFVGSEGTLGIVTEAELRLKPAPPGLLAGVVFFPSDDAAVEAVERWRESATPRMLEYLDRNSLGLLRSEFPEIPPDARACVLFEQELDADGDDEIDRWQRRLVSARALVDGSWFTLQEGPGSSADRERFRRFRHALPKAVNELVRRNGFLKLGSDYAVPVSRNRDMLAEYRRRLEAGFPGQYVIFGHIGDAHLHVNLLPRAQQEYAEGSELMVEFARCAVALGGTVSAEHGLGKRKAHLLPLQYSESEIQAMKDVKARLDPLWLLGQGTLFPMDQTSLMAAQ
ncbi:MAG: FAD-binding oxidoreductase [Bryobacterales bacterium]|nr:FAD-binding oxidoreductase [Bryobacterales bacterium]